MGVPCLRVSSFGSLRHFTKANKPSGAASRCLDCAVEKSCPYSAKKVYLEPAARGHTGWPLNAVADIIDVESITEALRTGPYGRCAYECDNDVCDNQVCVKTLIFLSLVCGAATESQTFILRPCLNTKILCCTEFLFSTCFFFFVSNRWSTLSLKEGGRPASP